jgi:hypothetical protein
MFITLQTLSSFAQSDSILNFIFVPHPRSEDKVHQSVLPQIEKIDYSKYDMTLLGGDLTWYTTLNRVSMDYCNNLFDLGNPNTLWTMGNHDLNNPNLVTEYTHRLRFYSYYRDSITFLVLDTELNSDGFNSSFISGDQLKMISNVCDTIAESRFLVLLHGRLLWMIGLDYFKSRIDSVAESTRQLDTTNFYQVVYPLLQKAKSRGIKVICLGGDKSKINIEYSPEDSITFYTSTMAPEFADSVNDVMVFSYNKKENTMSRDFIPLDKIAKKTGNPLAEYTNLSDAPKLRVIPSTNSGEIRVQLQSKNDVEVLIQIYTSSGVLFKSVNAKTNTDEIISLKTHGIYIIRAVSPKTVTTAAFVN